MKPPEHAARSKTALREAPLVLLGIGDSETRLKLRHALERGGLGVAESADSAACLDASERLSPDVVLIGLMPAEADPNRLCSLLNSRAGKQRTPVILLTDSKDVQAIQRAYDAGAADFISQPIDPAQIVHRVRFVLRAATARAQFQRCAAGEEAEVSALADLDRLLADLRASMGQAKASGRHTAVLCVDLHRFKLITASLESVECERLMHDVARRLRVGIRDDDVLAKLGFGRDCVSIARLRGDEFCILIRNVQETADVGKVGQRILDLMAQPFPIGGRETFLGISVGIACYPDEELSAEDLLKAAEKAAYCAKQDDASHLLFYSAGLDARAAERLALEVSLRRALERNELVLHYQPRVDIKSGRIIGVEALVRWDHPELGRVSPMQFIPLAEETGLIVPIGEWILATACEQNRRWQKAGIPPIRMAVNLSSVQFRQRELYESVASVLRSTGMDPRWLEFEITESLLMRDTESAIALLKRFKDLGLHLSIDDFGTGYSSLSYLKRFPIDAIKIDQSFVREMTTSTDDAALVTAMILMCRSLKLRVVAEGVETRSQLALLRILECDEIQGYLVSRPVPADEVAELLVGRVPSAFAA